MTYGLDTRLFIENGAAVNAAEARQRTRYGRWRTLDARARLNLIERAMEPANDAGDGYPLAL